MSVQKTSDGMWLVRWREQGHQRGRRFRLKGDADVWEREVERRRQLGPLALAQLTDRGSTLGTWIIDHWTPEHGAGLEQSTRDAYASVYGCHIEPSLGDVPITELTVKRLRAWQADRVTAGAGGSTIDKARTFLSSVLRHAAESEVIPANPMGLVRPPLAEHSDSVTPLAPITVEGIRAVLLAPMNVQVPDRTRRDGVRLSGHVVADERDALERIRDAAIVSVLAYAGLRPSELRALRWGDVRKATITIERAARADGSIKSTKNHEKRSVRLLAPLAADLAELRIAAGRPTDETRILTPSGATRAWTKAEWDSWRANRWQTACKLAGMEQAPRPYDLRHSFASLLLAEGRSVHYVAAQLGHSPTLTLTTYGHLFAEYADAARIDAEREIKQARVIVLDSCARSVHKAAA